MYKGRPRNLAELVLVEPSWLQTAGGVQLTPQAPQLFGSTGSPFTATQVHAPQKVVPSKHMSAVQLEPVSQSTVPAIRVNGCPAHTSVVTPVAMLVSKSVT